MDRYLCKMDILDNNCKSSTDLAVKFSKRYQQDTVGLQESLLSEQFYSKEHKDVFLFLHFTGAGQ